MNELEHFKQIHGKPLHVGMAVTVDQKHDFFNDWRGQFVVLGINFEKCHLLYEGGGYMNVRIGENWGAPGCDGWKPSDLLPGR